MPMTIGMRIIDEIIRKERRQGAFHRGNFWLISGLIWCCQSGGHVINSFTAFQDLLCQNLANGFGKNKFGINMAITENSIFFVRHWCGSLNPDPEFLRSMRNWGTGRWLLLRIVCVFTCCVVQPECGLRAKYRGGHRSLKAMTNGFWRLSAVKRSALSIKSTMSWSNPHGLR